MTNFLNLFAKPVYRVHVEGLSVIEKAVIGGLLHLAEDSHAGFKMEAEARYSDIFILDGSDPRTVAFGRSHARIDEHAIWIDPPANLKSSRQIKRPLRWPCLVEMLKQLVRGIRKPAAAVRRPPVMKIAFGRLCALSEGVLRKHIGDAAEAVVQAARAEMERFAATNQQISTNVFLSMLRKQFPANVDAAKILRELSTIVTNASGGANPRNFLPPSRPR